ncbi:MAG TPA: P-II family nitrogen regulator [Clostridiaceae bacterium]
MKKLEVIIRPEKLEELKAALNDIGIKGLTVSTVMGCGNQKGRKEIYRGTVLNINLLNKIKVETVIRDEILDEITKVITETVRTGVVGDGKIFVYNVENAIRIRTGEEGETAI